MIIEIEPLGTEILLPAIMIGYEIDFCFEDLPLGDLPDHPRWILSLAQQAGGYGSLPDFVLSQVSVGNKGLVSTTRVSGWVSLLPTPPAHAGGTDSEVLLIHPQHKIR